MYRHTSGVYEGGNAVTIVGYDQAGQYWVVKNSWGPSWGESGYFRIAFGQVGIEQEVASLTVLVSVATRTATLTQASSMYTQATITRTITSYTSTSYTSTSTIPALTTVALVPVTISQTLQSAEYVTSIRTTILTSYAETQTSRSTVLIQTTIVLVPTTTTQQLTTTTATSSSPHVVINEFEQNPAGEDRDNEWLNSTIPPCRPSA